MPHGWMKQLMFDKACSGPCWGHFQGCRKLQQTWEINIRARNGEAVAGDISRAVGCWHHLFGAMGEPAYQDFPCRFKTGVEVNVCPATETFVDDRVAPLNYQWTLWRMGNQNVPKKTNKRDNDELKMYRFLEKSPFINKMELDSFAIPEGLLNQPAKIVAMLHDAVDYYNTMMTIRRKYLFKKLNGCWCKEMELMLKSLDKYVELVDEKLEAISEAGGDCPPRPKVFDALPEVLK